MKRNTIRIITLVLSLSLFICSCSFAKKESPEDDEPADTSNIEPDLVGKIVGGFLYTGNSMTGSEDEKYYLGLRKDAVSLFNNAVALTSAAAFEASETLQKHETLLFEHMDLIKSDNYNTVGKITEGILANRLALNSLQEQLRLFSATAAEDDLAKTEIKRYIFETVCELCAHQKAYVSWLMGSTEVASVLLEQTDPDKAAELIEACVILYSDELKGDLTDMLFAYGRSVKIYTGITEADYLAGEYYLVEMKAKLDDMSPEERDLPMKLYEELSAQDRKPPTVEQAPNVEDTLHEAISLLEKLEQDIGAGESGETENMLFSNIISDTDKTNAIRDSFENYIAGISGELRIAIIHSAGIEKVLYMHTENESIIKNTAAKSSVSDMLYSADPKSAGTEKVLINEIQNDLRSQNIAAEEMESEAKPQLTKEQIIKLIETAQGALNFAGFITGKQSQYPIMLTLLNGLIVKVGKLDKELIENLISQLDKNLEELLGDKKQDLVDKLTDTKAEELIDTFTEWKDNTKNFSVLNYSKNDLIRLLNALGFYIPLEEVVIELKPPVEFWAGTVRYTERTDEFKDGSVYTSAISNDFSGEFLFTIEETDDGMVCEVDKVMTYDISLMSVTSFSIEGNSITILLEGRRQGVDYSFVWQGTINSDGTSMAGECFLTNVYTDEYLATLDNPNNFVLTSMTHTTGIWEAEKMK